MAQGHRIPQIQPVAGLQIDLASHISASEQQKRPLAERAVCGADHPQVKPLCAFYSQKDAPRPLLACIPGGTGRPSGFPPVSEGLRR